MKPLPPAPAGRRTEEGSLMVYLWNLLHRDRGAGTVEYVLVILAAAAIALSLIQWISGGGLLTSLFGAVLKKVIGFVK